MNPPSTVHVRQGVRIWLVAILVLTVLACSVYANLSYAVTNPADYRFFPPFQRGVDANQTEELGGEYYLIARSLRAGEGFAHPFGKRTGPTAWMPPLLPALQAFVLWIFGDSRACLQIVMVLLQDMTLVVTGLLVLALVQGQLSPWGMGLTAGLFVGCLLGHFHLCFQFTHDSWLVMLTLDLLFGSVYWGNPLGAWRTATIWGVLGGMSTLVNPVLGAVWFTLSLGVLSKPTARRGLVVALGAAGLILVPWIWRNYVVFGRFIPIKSNLAYELYQCQCLQSDGVLKGTTFHGHPFAAPDGSEGRQYQILGEAGFMDLKWRQFQSAVRAEPTDFARRVGQRFLAATFWYVPLNEPGEANLPLALWASRLTHPLPFLSLLFLALSASWRPLSRLQWLVIAAYIIYLLPYIFISYYDRYAFALLGVKVLLVTWAGAQWVSLWTSMIDNKAQQLRISDPEAKARCP